MEFDGACLPLGLHLCLLNQPKPAGGICCWEVGVISMLGAVEAPLTCLSVLLNNLAHEFHGSHHQAFMIKWPSYLTFRHHPSKAPEATRTKSPSWTGLISRNVKFRVRSPSIYSFSCLQADAEVIVRHFPPTPAIRPVVASDQQSHTKINCILSAFYYFFPFESVQA